MKMNTLMVKFFRHYLIKHEGDNLDRWTEYKKFDLKKDVDLIGDDVYSHKIDILYANKENRLGRAVFDIHGGAYIYSYRINNYEFASVFAKAGFDVVLLDYPHNDDCKDTLIQVKILSEQIRLVHERAKELNLDLEKSFIMGDSAGGHFALLLAECACDNSLQEAVGINLGEFAPSGVALCCPVYDYVRLANTSSSLTRGARKFMFGPDYKDINKSKLLSPKEHLDSLKIPLFLSACKNDFIGLESRDLKEDAFARSSLKFHYHYVDSSDRAVGHIHNVTNHGHPESIKVNQAIIDFFSRN